MVRSVSGKQAFGIDSRAVVSNEHCGNIRKQQAWKKIEFRQGIPYPDMWANTFGFECLFFQNDRYGHP